MAPGPKDTHPEVLLRPFPIRSNIGRLGPHPMMMIDPGPTPTPTAAIPIFACPVCGEPLPRADGFYACANSHVFDVARDGYVNLLLAQQRRSKDPGYSSGMIQARRRIFDAGLYERLADGIALLILSYLSPVVGQKIILDAGCGEGYYLRRLAEATGRSSVEDSVLRCGLDISKHGIRQAARRDHRGVYAVSSIFRMPVLPKRVHLLLSHFSPIGPDDFYRVVAPGGTVLVGGPGADHLYALKRLIYAEPSRQEASGASTVLGGFTRVAEHRIRYPLVIRGEGLVADLLAMTPFYWSAKEDAQKRLGALDALDSEIDVVIRAYRRDSNYSPG